MKLKDVKSQIDKYFDNIEADEFYRILLNEYNFKEEQIKQNIAKIEKAKIDYIRLEELACKILGLDYDEISADTEVIDKVLWDELNVNMEEFAEIISRLLPLINIGERPISGEVFKGFADTENSTWLVKQKINK